MKNEKELVALSPSRIKQFTDCSMLYYCSAVLKLPQHGNSGSARGSAIHNLLEHLIKPKHRDLVKKLLKTQDPDKVPAICRFLDIQIKKQKLDPNDEVKPIYKKDPVRTNKEEINAMLMLIVNLELKNPKKLVSSEYAFDYVDPLGFRIKGFMDAVREENDILYIDDYKSSKKVFNDAELATNLQGLIYTLAARKIWPKYTKYMMKFIFARFPKKPFQHVPEYSKEELDGLRDYLSYLSKILNNFNYKKAQENYAADNVKTKWLCGAGPTWRCAYRDPIDYWIIKEKNSDKIIKTGFLTETPPELEKNQVLIMGEYKGCKRWEGIDER